MKKESGREERQREEEGRLMLFSLPLPQLLLRPLLQAKTRALALAIALPPLHPLLKPIVIMIPVKKRGVHLGCVVCDDDVVHGIAFFRLRCSLCLVPLRPSVARARARERE